MIERGVKGVEICFKKIYERDMDLLILEEFLESPSFAELFLDAAGLGGSCEVIFAAHSLSEAEGESDITLVLQYANRKVALLIEDKIDAPTMPEQSLRYHKRAEQAKRRGEYDEYHVILVAPQAYHDAHQNDENAAYRYRVTYEQLQAWFAQQATVRSRFKNAMVEFAIEQNRAGYQVREVEAVTAFWRCLRRYCGEHYPQLSMLGADTPKGGSAAWPEFRTALEKVRVIYKSQKGIVDLEFPGFGDRGDQLRTVLGERLAADMRLEKTGKSASVRLENPQWAVSFHENFAEQETAVREALNAVSRLCRLAADLKDL